MLSLGATGASAQQSYTYYVKRTIPINWRPDSTSVQRYTVAVNPLMLLNDGLKADFEYELKTPGEWLQMGLVGYAAPARTMGYGYGYDYYDYHNNRWTPNSSGDDFRNMWGVGVSGLFKKMLHMRGWYFSTGIKMEFFRVGRVENGYIPYKEDGLQYYEGNTYLDTRSYFKTTAQFNLGKHFALSRRCFIDAFIGVSYSYSLYNSTPHTYSRDNQYDYNYYYTFSDMNGFARRGLNLNGGLRFGVLLWDDSAK
jgi:hypothetical protein